MRKKESLVFDAKIILGPMNGEEYKTGSEFRARVKELVLPHLAKLPPDVCSIDIADLMRKNGWIFTDGDRIKCKIGQYLES